MQWTTAGNTGWKVPKLRARKVPLRRWLVMVALYFCVSTLNNLALGYRISIPLHIVFRSSGLIANMACGYFLMKRTYPAKQVVAVVMVSVGVVIATLASVGNNGSENSNHSASNILVFGRARVPEALVGVCLLALGVALAALLGLYQETTYRRYGKHWQEGLFYNHLLALPMFLPFARDILTQAHHLSQSAPVSLMGLALLAVPWLWVSLAGNVLSQLVCVSGVHRFTAMSSSLTLNVVLNLRKLVSLVLSVVLFRNPVTPGMLVGCALVFVGTFAYSQASAAATSSSSSPPPRTAPIATTDSAAALPASLTSKQQRAARRRPAAHNTPADE
ncbi:golgi uridine diphosphate-N- acetylglucosamine transporter [Coemansia sp. Benny D115]|nr:golgi uridine diphosphate-N- acetylglucosamine transporter [Coemansia sp. Benny D115]